MENGNVAEFFILNNRVGILLFSDFLRYTDNLAQSCRKKGVLCSIVSQPGKSVGAKVVGIPT